MKPLRWRGFQSLLWELVDDRLASVAGDERIAAKACWDVIIENLWLGHWVARTTAPANFTHLVGEISIPLEPDDKIEPNFWREYLAAAETGADRESLSQGGPWAQYRGDKDSFAFSLPGNICRGPARGFAEGVEVQIRTGDLARSPAGRPRGTGGYASDEAVCAQAQHFRDTEGLSKRAAANKALLDAGIDDNSANVDRIRKALR